MRTARLVGSSHHVTGAIAAVSEAEAAITLSRGGFRKTYEYTDPNEDAVCFALGEHGSLVAVADGHFGARGAARAVEWLLEERAAAWTRSGHFDAGSWAEAGAEALRGVHRALHRQAEELGVAPAPTTLSLALVRPGEGLLLHASVGDSHVFVAGRAADQRFAARDLAWATTGQPRCYFAGDPYQGPDLESSQWVIGSEALEGLAAVVLASDGLSERRIGVADPAAAAAASIEHATRFEPGRRALEACRHVTEAALEAHRSNRSGDNMCAAVVWLAEAPAWQAERSAHQ